MWKSVISEDVTRKCVSFLNKFLPLWLHSQEPLLELHPLCLLFFVGGVLISLNIKRTGNWKNHCLPSSKCSAFSSLQGRRGQLEGRGSQQPCQMPAVFMEENDRIPRYPERGFFLNDGKTCRAYSHALRLVLMRKNDFWCHCACVDYRVWPHQLLGSVSAEKVLSWFPDFVTREGNMARVHCPAEYLAFSQEHWQFSSVPPFITFAGLQSAMVSRPPEIGGLSPL